MKLFFSKQVTERIQKTTGLRITVHQFRHAAAAIYLKHHPGNYEHIRLIAISPSITQCWPVPISPTRAFGSQPKVAHHYQTEK